MTEQRKLIVNIRRVCWVIVFVGTWPFVLVIDCSRAFIKMARTYIIAFPSDIEWLWYEKEKYRKRPKAKRNRTKPISKEVS